MGGVPKSLFLWLLWEDKARFHTGKTCFKNRLVTRPEEDTHKSEWGGQGWRQLKVGGSDHQLLNFHPVQVPGQALYFICLQALFLPGASISCLFLPCLYFFP